MTGCRHREILNRIGDKWAIYAIGLLSDGPRRFTELLRGIEGITARMLTVTLRGLERDGLVTRTMHPVIPPRVDYELTPLGKTLLDTIAQLLAWADTHAEEIEAAQVAYDARGCGEAAQLPGSPIPDKSVTWGRQRAAAARYIPYGKVPSSMNGPPICL